MSVTFPRVARAELLKLRTVRSTVWTLLAFLVVVIGINVLVALVTRHSFDTGRDVDDFQPVRDTIVPGLLFGQLAVGVLGVIAGAGEYSSGMIRASLTAVPRRLEFLGAKLAVFAVVAFVLSLVTTVVCFVAGQAALGDHGTSLGHAPAVRGLVGSSLYVVLLGLLGVALGVALRNAAAAIGVLVVALFIAPLVLNFLPGGAADHVSKYLPLSVLGAVAAVHTESNDFGAWTGLLVFAVEVAVVVVLAGALLRRRDA